MSWWRKKADQDLSGEDILNLDDIVWRGINQEERLVRLADAAEQTHDDPQKQDTPKGQGLNPSADPASQALAKDEALIEHALQQMTTSEDEMPEKVDQARQVLPTLPFPDQDASHEGEQGTPQNDLERDPEGEMESSLRSQIIDEAMDAVLAFQHQSQDQNLAQRLNPQQIKTKISEITDQSLSDGQSRRDIPAETSTGAPDMSDAIRHVVADEIGSWLKDHMPRIIAETMAEAEVKKTAPSIPSSPAKKNTAKKSSAKAANKAKTASKSAASPKAKAKAKPASSAKKSKSTASGQKKAPKSKK